MIDPTLKNVWPKASRIFLNSKVTFIGRKIFSPSTKLLLQLNRY
uniref:Uncharacterized protein n=1 Tax=Amphimedon queenslandica TaxID=400682 RepID=A0A1X7TS13_AMPQE